MAEYINIKGTNRQVLSSDPSNPTIGQIWYNTTSNSLKGYVFNAAGWATGGSLNTARADGAGFGLQTAAIVAGGGFPEGNETQSYNGTSWTTLASIPVALRSLNCAGAGTQAAGFFVGGWTGSSAVATTQEWNGSGWTATNNFPITSYNICSMGTQTAAVSATGEKQTAPAQSAVSAEYDGSSWTAGNPVNTGRYGAGSAGTQTAGLIFAGNVPASPEIGTTEEYNGTCWATTAVTTVPSNYSAGLGLQTAAIKAGGEVTPNQAVAEEYNGTSWTSITSMPAGKVSASPAGTTSAGLVSGGYSPGVVTTVFEWNGAAAATVTIDPV